MVDGQCETDSGIRDRVIEFVAIEMGFFLEFYGVPKDDIFHPELQHHFITQEFFVEIRKLCKHLQFSTMFSYLSRRESVYRTNNLLPFYRTLDWTRNPQKNSEEMKKQTATIRMTPAVKRPKLG